MRNSSKHDSTTSGDASAADSKLYSSGDKILAYHGPRIYEAKVQKAEIRKNGWRYFVHYLGWNKRRVSYLFPLFHFIISWDEWVGGDRLMKYTEENVMKRRALNKKQNVDKNVKSGRSGQPKAKTSVVSKVKKQKHDSGVESGVNYRKGGVTVEKLVKIQIPTTLKKQLMDDWTFVTQQDKLVKLPRSPTIDDILTKYLDYKTKKDNMVADSIGESLKGIRRYFDRALPIMLLYKKERKQYSEAIVDGVSPSSIYGAEHLLRLFVKLPELLAYVNIEEETLNSLQQIFLDFLK
ncbi:hypothetical protein TanjilG_07678 [Lupinus angustifolius]|uniref:Uncharacterized protein n=1 Tax=Lupinus angustifolius TaxID=3871 RepID=A0A1J7G0H1_LUPAN|nr:hypothetical protein TanjilG_07678 [Lupinus angustifolius]